MSETLVSLLFFLPTVLSAVYQNGDLRLVGSDFKAEGRVEIYHENKWGTICDDRWGIEEANVTCKQYGYPLGAQYWYSNAYFGKGNGTIWLDDVTCFGNETKLMNCRHNGWEGHNCRHYEDVAVVCRMEENYTTGACDFEKGHGMCGYRNIIAKNTFNWTFGGRNVNGYRWPKTDHTTEFSTGKGFYATTFLKFWKDIIQGQPARLQSPAIASAKCVEFYYFMGGTTVGELLVYLKSDTQGEKVVWQLIGDQGYQWRRGAFPVNSTYKNFNIIFEGIAGTGFYGSDVAIDDISVNLSSSCEFNPKDARPVPATTQSKTIRLVPRLGSSVKSAGRVEVYHNKRWGTVCSNYWFGDSFDIKAATVVCKELGYEGAELVVPCCEVFGKGTGHIWLDRVKCLGTEPSITMCPHSGWGKTYCSHDSDIAVICKTKETDRSEFAVRLGNETGVNFQGRVEVNIGGIWGTVTDRGWDIYDANVVCKQLGFKGAVGAFTGSSFGKGSGPIWMSDFDCNGTENKLAQCNHSNTEKQKTWGHYLDASVECYDLRLANGGSSASGRVEVRYGGSWGTICKHNWDITASNLVCKQLGYKRAESVANFGPGSGQIFLDNVQCKGNEPGLSFCRHRGWFAHNCTHNDDVGIVCTNATCSQKVPCKNGGSCDSGVCNCAQYFVGELCKLPVENKTVKVEFGVKIQQWNKTSFIHNLVQDLNNYCSSSNCSASLSKAQKSPLVFEDPDIQIVEAAKKKDKGVAVGFVVLYTDGINTTVMPRSFVHKFITSELSENDKLAGYQVITVDGKGTNEGKPGGQHSNKNKSSKKTYIYIIVGVVFGLIFVLALIFVVKRYGKRLRGSEGSTIPSRLSDQSYLALHAEDYDESMDDTALLRPPQQPTSEGDLLS